MESAEKCHQNRIMLAFCILCMMLLFSPPAYAQQSFPGLEDFRITSMSEEFTVDTEVVIESLQNPAPLREAVESQTNFKLPGGVDGVFFGKEIDKLNICKIICTGEDGTPPCFTTCGAQITQ